jgi:hypothetical protein
MRRLSLDDARLLPHLRADRERELPASAALDDVLEAEAELVRRPRRGVGVVPSAAELRGVPVVGSGPGATPGSNPVLALLAKERRCR